MWGQVFIAVFIPCISRIIPTRVGTRTFCFYKIPQPRDHPHACGDKLIRYRLTLILRGSSPRVWGQVYQKYDGNQPVRIIPTRVGTRTAQGAVIATRKDHPHACGDKVHIALPHANGDGSSPRVWGQDICINMSDNSFRIIPTRVGTSLRTSNIFDIK